MMFAYFIHHATKSIMRINNSGTARGKRRGFKTTYSGQLAGICRPCYAVDIYEDPVYSININQSIASILVVSYYANAEYHHNICDFDSHSWAI